MDWRMDAECKDADGDLFFPAGTTGSAVERQTQEAKDICADCGVRNACLHWALDTNQDGIWGGTTVEERSALRGQSSLPVWVSR